jgi:Ca2+-binding RTX toxin-like protein
MATIDGDDGDNALNGTSVSDLIRAFGGDDDILYSAGFDEIHGGSGFDQIHYETLFQGIVVNFTGLGSGTVTKYYGPGNTETDTFFEIEGIIGTQYADAFNNSSDGDARYRGLQGADVYNGSATGFDEVDYRRDANFGGGFNPVFVDLTAGTGTDGFGNTEILNNIDGVRGTNFSDVLLGSAGDNVLNGEGGSDFFRGFAGNDNLIGGEGNDTVDYSQDVAWGAAQGIDVNQGVRVNQLGNGPQGGLPADTVIGSFGDTDTIRDIPNIIATMFADEVWGGLHNNVIVLGAGDDFAYGHEGNDRLEGGSGSDALDGGDGMDAAVLGGLNGGGHDLLQFAGTVYALDLRDRSTDTNTNIEVFRDSTQAVGVGAVEQFDALAYAASYDNLAQFFRIDGNAAVQHYVTTGFFEGREVAFDASQYLANYADLQAAFGNDLVAATQHFLQSGVDEHRLAEDALDYIASYADLIGAFGARSEGELEALGLMHYAAAGFDEGRRAGIDFDAEQYLANYGDLQAAFGGDDDAAAVHFINAGHGEHRLADDPLDYIAGLCRPDRGLWQPGGRSAPPVGNRALPDDRLRRGP